MNNLSKEYLISRIWTRFDNVKSCSKYLFREKLTLFYNFLINNSISIAVIEEIYLKYKDKKNEIESTLTKQEKLNFKLEIEQIIATLVVLELSIKPDEYKIESFIGKQFDYQNGGYPNDYQNIFITDFVKPLVQYITEKIDVNSIILNLCKRFKQKSEYFEQANLIDLYNSNTRQGENNLAKEFYKFLFGEAIDVSVEPQTKSGRPDMVLKINEETIISDVKLFDNASKGKTYIAKGVNQLRNYLKEDNQPYGFLLIFELCKKSLDISTSTYMGFPYLEIDNKIIYFVIVDIHSYTDTASKRGIADLVTMEATDFTSK